MKTCHNCGMKIPDEAMFCRECGAKQRPAYTEENRSQESRHERFCPHCGKVIPTGTLFCRHCGKKLVSDAADPVKQNPPGVSAVKKQANPNSVRRGRSFIWIIPIAGLAAAAGIFFLVSRGAGFGNGSKSTGKVDVVSSSEMEKKGQTNVPSEDSENPGTGTTSEIGESRVDAASVSEQPEPAATSSSNDEPGSEETGVYGRPIKLNARYSASSTFSDTIVLGGTNNLGDMNLGTPWIAGSLEDSDISIQLDYAQNVYGIAIAPGWQQDQQTYDEYGYPISIDVRIGDVHEEFSFDPDESPLPEGGTQVYYFDLQWGPVLADQAVVSMNEGLSGSSADGYCVSELFLYTYAEDEAFAAKENPAFKRTKASVPAAVNSDDVLPQSSTEYLDKSDITSLSKEELQLAINEIFARNGYIFKTESIQKYFETKPWYHGDSNDQSVVDKRFSKIEKANVDLIRSYQKEKGYVK